MKYPGLRGGKTANSTNNAELPPQIATFLQQFLTISVAKNVVVGNRGRLGEPTPKEIKDYSLPPATTLRGGRLLMSISVINL